MQLVKEHEKLNLVIIKEIIQKCLRPETPSTSLLSVTFFKQQSSLILENKDEGQREKHTMQ